LKTVFLCWRTMPSSCCFSNRPFNYCCY